MAHTVPQEGLINIAHEKGKSKNVSVPQINLLTNNFHHQNNFVSTRCWHSSVVYAQFDCKEMGVHVNPNLSPDADAVNKHVSLHMNVNVCRVCRCWWAC